MVFQGVSSILGTFQGVSGGFRSGTGMFSGMSGGFKSVPQVFKRFQRRSMELHGVSGEPRSVTGDLRIFREFHGLERNSSDVPGGREFYEYPMMFQAVSEPFKGVPKGFRES